MWHLVYQLGRKICPRHSSALSWTHPERCAAKFGARSYHNFLRILNLRPNCDKNVASEMSQNDHKSSLCASLALGCFSQFRATNFPNQSHQFHFVSPHKSHYFLTNFHELPKSDPLMSTKFPESEQLIFTTAHYSPESEPLMFTNFPNRSH